MTLRAFIAGATILFAACVRTPQTEMKQNEPSSAWTVRIETSGGIAGRGLGSVTVDSAGNVAAGAVTRTCDGRPELRALDDAVRLAVPQAWKASYAAPGSRGYADQIEYRLTLTRGGTFSARWYDENVSLLPSDLTKIYEAAWAVRTACAGARG